MTGPWVADRKDSTGYDVRKWRGGNLLGWVRFDRDAPAGQWRAFCMGVHCHELGQAGTKADAAGIVQDHNITEHDR